MTSVTFTHANFDPPREVMVSRELVFAIYYSASHKATHLLSNGGGIIPVRETVEQATRMVYGDSTKTAQPAKEI